MKMSKKVRFMSRIVTIVLLILCVSLSFNTTSFAGAKETDVQYITIYRGIVVDASASTNTTNSGNWTWALAQNWCRDENGIYIIEDMIINNTNTPTGSGILINNSHDVDFRIENCTITNVAAILSYSAGIDVINSSRGVIFNNTVDQTNPIGCGIQLKDYNCYNITIEQNVVKNIFRHGILAYGGDNIHVINNTVENVAYNGIYFYEGVNESTIAYNFVDDTNNNEMSGQNGGIKLLDDNCDNNLIFNNTITHAWRGMYLRDSSNNSIYNNTVKDNYEAGIVLSSESYHNNVTENIVVNNSGGYNQDHGIWLAGSHFNKITKNLISKNQNGIYLQGSNSNNITGNFCNDNLQRGMYISDDSGANNVTENTINDNYLIGLFLSSSCDHSIIKDNSINRNGLGIGLYENSLNNITDNSLIDNEYCIYELDCTDNIFKNNTCTDPTAQLPIHINGDAIGLGAQNWTWAVSQEWCSGSGTELDPYVIENLKINGFGFPGIIGIEIENSNVSFIIRDCLIINNDYGVYFDYVNNSRLIGNNCSNNNYGIYISASSKNTLAGNIILDNENEGIYMYDYCANNTISGNMVNYNGYGIYVEFDCVNNSISGNTINDSGSEGIYFYDDCNNNTVQDNIIRDNENGIYLDSTCDSNILTGNILEHNDVGIRMYECNYATVTENVLNNNTMGMEIETNSDHNTFYSNFFVNNEWHAEDWGTENSWNCTTIGNYWENWTSPDANSDGIVDNPYNITGPALSRDYLPIAEDGAPNIIIRSPEDGDRIGSTAPSFEVEVTDVYVWEMWYTLDGGLNNYTFTEDGPFVIDQTAWDALPNEDITIRFYASDIAGNIFYEEITIRKYSTLRQTRLKVLMWSLIAVVAITGAGSYFLLKFWKIKLEE
jgi:parallel beta-helix repeat protein